MVSDERVEELFGTKEEYYREMAEAFYCNPDDPSIWVDKETLNLEKSWLKEEDRSVKKNVWGEFKRLFKNISQDGSITNRAKHMYDSITLGQLCLFMLLIRIRRRMVRLCLPCG